jgi:hypothetical protein
VLRAVAKEDTLNRLSTQLGAFAWSKKNIANATKKTKGRVIRSVTSETLKRNTTLQGCGGLKVDEIGGNRHSLSPEVRRKRGSDHHRTSRLKQVAMLALSHAILGMGARAGELGKSALLSKKTTQQLGDILTSRISPKDTYRRGKLSMDHGSKTLIYRENLAARSHKINPSVAREVIDKKNIVAVAPLGSKRSRTPYIRMDQIKRTLRYRRTSRIR